MNKNLNSNKKKIIIEEFFQSFKGPQGPQGPQGPPGPISTGDFTLIDGNLVYTDNNNVQKTVISNIYSVFKGPQGDQGIQGPIGPQGPIGSSGPHSQSGRESMKTYFYKDNKDIPGYDMPDMPILNSSISDCNNRCKNDINCKFWCYGKDNKYCWLKTTNTNTNKNIFIKDNNNNGVYMNNQELTYGITSLGKIENIINNQECVDLCLNNNDCELVIYDIQGRICDLSKSIDNGNRIYGVPYR